MDRVFTEKKVGEGSKKASKLIILWNSIGKVWYVKALEILKYVRSFKNIDPHLMLNCYLDNEYRNFSYSISTCLTFFQKSF